MNTTSTVPLENPYLKHYHYIPSFAAGVTFISLFALSTALHGAQALYYRLWWLWPSVVLGGFGEIVGWSGRTWSSKNSPLKTPFLMQITTTIISPTFILAANFIIVGRLIRYLGPQYCRVTPKRYMQIFCFCDFISLCLQGAGGGLASTATTQAGTNQGGNVMLGGIVFQLVVIIFFSTVTIEFFWRFYNKRPVAQYDTKPETEVVMDLKQELMVFGIGLNILCMFIRAIYRTIELSNGWNGRIISTQTYFLALDGGMMIIAIFTLNIFHPGLLLSEEVLHPVEDK